MTEVPESIGQERFFDDVSESSGDVALSDPSDAEESGSEEEFQAVDHVAEQAYRVTQEDSDEDAHHEAELAAYLARHRSQDQDEQEQKPQSDSASAADMSADSELRPAAAGGDEPEPAAAKDHSASTTADNGHSTVVSEAGDHEQAAEVPALTAETQQDAVLPSIEAVSAENTFQPDPEPAEQSQSVKDETPAKDDRSGEADQQPADTRPSFADIQKVLDTAASDNVHAESDSNNGKAEPEDNDNDSTAESELNDGEAESAQQLEAQGPLPSLPELASAQQDDNEPEAAKSAEAISAAEPEAAGEPEAAAQPEAAAEPAAVVEPEAAGEPEAAAEPEAEAEEELALEQTQPIAESASTESPYKQESAPTVATSTTESRTVTSSEKSSGSSMPRLPSLPVRRGAPSLPSRALASTGSGTAATSAPTVSSQQEAAPPASTANNGSDTASRPALAPNSAPGPAPTPPAASTPVVNNGHTHDTEIAAGVKNGNGQGTSSSVTAVSHPTSSSNSAGSSANNGVNPPRQPVGNANPSIPPRPTGNANPSIPPRPTGSANPSIPPRPSGTANPSIPARQQAVVPAGPARQSAGNGQVGAAAAPAAEEESAENRELREKVQNFRVLLVRLTLRLGQSTRGSIVQQVNYRLDLAERIRMPQTSSSTRRVYGFEAACRQAEDLESQSADQLLPFACTVMVIGMSGVGKSATINSVLDADAAAPTNAFEPGTNRIREINGTVAGVRVKFIDTPGLQPSAANIGSNQRLLNQMHGAFQKYKPDIMLYMDRADVFRTDMADVPLLTAITETFGPNMWFNTIVALTHAAAAPPDGTNGPITYDTYTRTRTQLLQQNIRQASGDMRLLNPVALVENHPACRKNERGYAVLPNQLVWKPHLILLLLSSKLLSETDALLKIQQDSSAGDAQRRAMRMLLAGRKMPPIPYLIASFIQKKSPRKPPDEEQQFKHDSELKDLSQMEKKEEMRRRREYSRLRIDEAKAEAGANQAGVPAPDIPLQPSFDADNNSHRYRYMEPPPDAAICRPVVDPNCLDHDDGMNAFTVEKNGVLRKRGTYVGGAPGFVMAQVHKDKDMFNIVSEAEASYYHTHKLISTASFDAQTVQSDALFTGKLETRFKNHPKNKTAAGLLVSRLKEDGGLPTKGPVVYGAKIEDRFKPTDKVKVVLASATLMNKTDGRGGKEQAWNHTAETRIKAGEDDKLLVSVGLNNMRYRGKSGFGGNVSAQYAATQGTTVASNIQLNNERAGKMSLRVTSHDRPQLGFSLLLPVVGMILGKIRGRD
ncbi:TPA: hypothetical protein ACH3X1_006160 [Trebouxia sp. C0004]